MAKKTKINWVDHTWNPWWGCQKVSPACANCYAESIARRYGHHVWGPTAPRRMLSDAAWKEPLRWNRAADQEGTKHKVFCASMADVFEDRSDLLAPRLRLWKLIEATPHLEWLLLTKRPENIRRMTPWGADWPRNVWMGVTAESQDYADLRVPVLVQQPAVVRFLSVEPMLGPVDLSPWRGLIDWVICGGESIRADRPLALEWVRALRDQCVEMGIAFHFKQWGKCQPPKPYGDTLAFNTPTTVKEFAILDGQKWDQFPVYRWRRTGEPMTLWDHLLAYDPDDASSNDTNLLQLRTRES
jgi:protein gp37